jgi:hypothetical protein
MNNITKKIRLNWNKVFNKRNYFSEIVKDDLDFQKSLSVEEQTLYRKWVELTKDVRFSFDVDTLKDNIWKPTDIMNMELTINEVNNLQPYVEICKTSEDSSLWNVYRRMLSSASYSPNPGRLIRSYVKDRVSGKILGLISLGSDVSSLRVRDEFVGWSKDNRFLDKKINHSCIGTTIIPTQPLGYNFLGGKLVSVLTTSETFRKEWYDRYGDVLVMVNTTSLYGIQSQYNGIPHFKTLGVSSGKIKLTPTKEVFKQTKKWMDKIGVVIKVKDDTKMISARKQNQLGKMCKELGIKFGKYNSGYERGVYCSMMYTNGKDLLCGNINETQLILNERYVNGDEKSINWWKEKSIKRYKKLMEENRIKDETLWYSPITKMDWKQCKETYLSDIGR